MLPVSLNLALLQQRRALNLAGLARKNWIQKIK